MAASTLTTSTLSSNPNIAVGLFFIGGSSLIGAPSLSLTGSGWAADTTAIPGSSPGWTTLGFSDAGHPGTGDNTGHVAQIAMPNQFATAHFRSAPDDNGGALAGVMPEVNPVATIAQHHP